jgi:glycosyltransferase involved in cell wall biosynthesis
MGWARYLKEQGWDPIIVTRNWEQHISHPDKMHCDSGVNLITETNEFFEVNYLPFKGNLRDRLYSKYGNTRFILLRKVLSFIELLGSNFNKAFIPYSNLHAFALDYCKKHDDVKAIIVTGNPFEIFRFGYEIHKQTNIPWIADYRDDWTTSDVNYVTGLLNRFLFQLNKRSEKKWVGTSACITTVSPYYAQKIGRFVQKPGHVLLNGFFEDDIQAFQNRTLYDDFTIIYNGMLYGSQQIEIFLAGFKKFVDANPEFRHRIKLQFPGILYLKDIALRVEKFMTGYEDTLLLTERISREKVLEMQSRAHLLLMVSHIGSKGSPSSKIYEYLGLGRPVLVCPGDEDILDETFTQYNLGFIANTSDETYDLLTTQFQKYLDGSYETMQADTHYTAQFARSTQAKVLADLLNKVSE